MAHPAFVWRAYYRQNRASFPSAFPAGKLDALAICEEEEEDGEGRKALITRRATQCQAGRWHLQHGCVGKGERGSPCPLQSHHSWNPMGFGEPPSTAMHAWCHRAFLQSWEGAGILASHYPCQWGLWAACALLQGGIYPWRVVRAVGCARCTCSRVPVGRQRAPTDICQA